MSTTRRQYLGWGAGALLSGMTGQATFAAALSSPCAERLVWRDQQWQVSGWALSPGHWQNWQTALAVAGFSPQTEQSQWAEAQWRLADGLAAKQHLFQLTLTLPASAVKP